MKNILSVLKLVLVTLWVVFSFACGGSKSGFNQSPVMANSNNSSSDASRTPTPKPPSEVSKISWDYETYETGVCKEKQAFPSTIKLIASEFSEGTKVAFIPGNKVYFGDLNGDGNDEVMVPITCASGGVKHFTFELQFFTAQNKIKRFLARLDAPEIENDYKQTNPKGGISGFSSAEVKDGRLILKLTTYESNGSGYNSETDNLYMTAFTYKFDNGKLVSEGKPIREKALSNVKEKNR